MAIDLNPKEMRTSFGMGQPEAEHGYYVYSKKGELKRVFSGEELIEAYEWRTSEGTRLSSCSRYMTRASARGHTIDGYSPDGAPRASVERAVVTQMATSESCH